MRRAPDHFTSASHISQENIFHFFRTLKCKRIFHGCFELIVDRGMFSCENEITVERLIAIFLGGIGPIECGCDLNEPKIQRLSVRIQV